LRTIEQVGAGHHAEVEAERVSRGGDRALGLAVGGGLDGHRQHGDAAVAERAEVLEALAHPAIVVEDDLAGGAQAGQCIA
jgi:hypothetical protein